MRWGDGVMDVGDLVKGGKREIKIRVEKKIELRGKGWRGIGRRLDK